MEIRQKGYENYRKGLQTTVLSVSWKKVLQTFMLGCISLLFAPATHAVLSKPTGQIYGRAPMAEGETLELTMRHSAENIKNNGLVPPTWAASKFGIGSITGLTGVDEDGDCDPPRKSCDPVVSTVGYITLSHNGKALTAEQMKGTLDPFLGESLEINVVTNATVTSSTGIPVKGTHPVTASIVVNVQERFAYNVNAYTFKYDSGFPTSGFTGAFYQITVDGSVPASGAYTWVTDKPGWVSVSDTGLVTFTAQPPSGQGNFKIYATSSRTGIQLLAQSAEVSTWYSPATDGLPSRLFSEALDYCRSQGKYINQYSKVVWGTAGTRGSVGKMWSEWGHFKAYPSLAAILSGAAYFWVSSDNDPEYGRPPISASGYSTGSWSPGSTKAHPLCAVDL